MQVINWEEYIKNRGGANFNNASELHAGILNHVNCSLALTVGVFDGVHLGHQALIQRICESSFLPTVVTFRQNPAGVLKTALGTRQTLTGDIFSLEQKLHVLETLGVALAVLIDFSENFSKMNGRDFIDLLLSSRPVKLIALGRNFRCGHLLDTGVEEIQNIASLLGVETWVTPPVMDKGLPVSSSRIRQALAAGRMQEAQRLLGRSIKMNSAKDATYSLTI